MRDGYGREYAVRVDAPDHREVREPGDHLIDDPARDFAHVQRGKDEARDGVEERRSLRGRLGESLGASNERGGDDVAGAHREVFLDRAPVPLASDVLVAEQTRETTVDPDGNIEDRRDPTGSGVVAQVGRTRIAAHVGDAQDTRATDRLEVRVLVTLEERGSSLERAGAGDVAGVAVQARLVVTQAPEAHALHMQHLGIELQDLADRRAPVPVWRRRELQERLGHPSIGGRSGAARRLPFRALATVGTPMSEVRVPLHIERIQADFAPETRELCPTRGEDGAAASGKSWTASA